MVLSPETVNAYKELLTNPQKHGLQFKPLHECEDAPVSLALIMARRSHPTGRKYEDGADVMENDIIRIKGMAHDFKVYYSTDNQCYMCEDLSNSLKYQLNTFNSLAICKVNNYKDKNKING